MERKATTSERASVDLLCDVGWSPSFLRTIDKPDTMGHKIRFHTLLIRYFTHFENNYMICKQYNEIYNTVFKPEFKPEEVDGKYSTTEEKLEVCMCSLQNTRHTVSTQGRVVFRFEASYVQSARQCVSSLSHVLNKSNALALHT